jgi:hypothetical protein
LTIDPKTGLAELPSDMFWRLEDHHLSPYSYPEASQREGIKIKLIQKYTEITEASAAIRKETVQRVGFWSRLFLGPTYERTVSEIVGGNAIEKEYEILYVSTLQTYRTSESQETPREGFTFAGLIYMQGEPKYVYLKADPINADTLSDLSLVARRKWVNRDHEDALNEDAARYRQIFTGDYPPKTLVGV